MISHIAPPGPVMSWTDFQVQCRNGSSTSSDVRHVGKQGKFPMPMTTKALGGLGLISRCVAWAAAL